jgi:tetratricopeptide (TPR) repeat protein
MRCRVRSSLHGADCEPAHVARAGVGLALTKLGRLDEADAILTPLLKGPVHSSMEEVFIRGRLGQLRSAQGRHEEALAMLRDTPDAFRDKPTPRLRALALSEYGHALLAAGRISEALETVTEARQLLLDSVPKGSPDLADMAVDIAQAQWALGYFREALAAAEDAARFWIRCDRNHRDSAIALLWLARARSSGASYLRRARPSIRPARCSPRRLSRATARCCSRCAPN